MMIRRLLACTAFVALFSGCFGLPPGSADTGDLVSVRYTVSDLDSGETLRVNRSASFDVGSGASGLGLQLERAIRGHAPGETFSVVVRDDASLDYGETVEVNRTLTPIPIEQGAPRDDFENFVGVPVIGLTFPAYGIYTGRVTGASNETVDFRVEAEDGQEDPVPSVGAVLVTHVGATTLTRELRPVVGATFSVAPPSPFQPSTPLGLQPGSYKVAGATESKLQFLRSASQEADLIGKDLRFTITVLAVTPRDEAVPTDGNFGVRPRSPMVNGDPNTALGSPLPTGDGHDHAH